MHSIQSSGARITALLAALLLTACGGGGGSPGAVGAAPGTGGTGTGSGGTVVAAPTVSVGLVNANGTATNSLSSATPLTVQALVLGADKKPVPNALVTFSTDSKLALFSPDAGTALTDDRGIASISMRSANLAAGGAGTVTATTTVGGAAVTGTGNYSVGATTVAFGPLTAQPASIQAYGSTLLSVDVLSGSAKYTEQQINVNFSSACVTAGKATLSAVATTNGGTAQTVYRDKGCGTSDIVTASASGVSKPVSATIQVAPPTAASLQFVKAEPLDQSIVIQGQGGSGRTETATLTFKVVDTSGNPITGKQVNFTTASTSVKINTPNGITDTDGNVSTTVNSGAVPTSFRVQATLAGTGGQTISTLSDSIVVTTGLPVQNAFSISVGTFNVEGWSQDSSPTKPATNVNVMVADANGNPVADGTPIVFQTNMGSIGTASKGGCNTVNGGCSVDFRTQEPRVPKGPNLPATPCNTKGAVADSTRPGVATICASTSDGLNTVYANAYITFSDTKPAYIYVDDVLRSTSPIDLGSTSTKDPKTIKIQVNDINLNPMPAGTKISLVSPQDITVVDPASITVASIAPDPKSKTSRQGSVHSFTLTSPNAKVAPCVESKATFKLEVTSPSGLSTHIPFKLTFSCP